MGKKIPMWQCILVMIVLIALIFWGVKVDTDAGEANFVLILAGAFAAVIAVITVSYTHLSRNSLFTI